MTGGPQARSIVVATRNPHKLEELAEILRGYELLPLPADVELPPEDGETFIENALGKARAAHRMTGAAVIADDSGISARALGGAPGSAPPVTPDRRRATPRTSTLLIDELRDAGTDPSPTSARSPTSTSRVGSDP